MRGNIFIVAVFVSTSILAQQRYISSGIIAFSGGAYERTIRDMNEALKSQGSLSVDEASKVYFYRAAAYSRLAQSNSPQDPAVGTLFLSAYSDLRKVRSYGISSWVERSNGEFAKIYPNLKQQAELAYESSNEAISDSEQRALISRSLNYIQACMYIYSAWDTSELLGKVYNDLAILDAEDSVDYLERSLTAYEQAYQNNSSCGTCLDGMIKVAEKLGNAKKIAEYQELRIEDSE